MSHPLDRLISLAQKTGDKLIVHDPIYGNDVVIMDVDSYERLALEKKTCADDLEMPWEDEFGDEEDPWHSAGSILEERQKNNSIEDDFWPWEPEMEDGAEEQAQETVPQSIPEMPQVTLEANEWKEEPLSGDEPVFYEEPV